MSRKLVIARVRKLLAKKAPVQAWIVVTDAKDKTEYPSNADVVKLFVKNGEG